jgi:hypothetical protein
VRMLVIPGSYQNYQNGAVNDRLTGGDRESVHMWLIVSLISLPPPKWEYKYT